MRLRLVADDLTGALDTAAQFVGRTGPVPVFWREPAPGALPPSAALDGGTRERPPAEAEGAAGRAAALLAPAPGVVAFKKIDSLLRGHAGLELAASLRALPGLSRCIVAPAFPFQGRVTRGGLQHARAGTGWQAVGEDLRATLAAHGMEPRLARPGSPVPAGVSLWDAESDEDLRRIAEAGTASGAGVLWCGSGGLAGALAGAGPPVSGDLARPVLGLFGSDHPATEEQLRAAGPYRLRLADGGEVSARAVARRLADTGVALAGFDLPAGLSRPEAAARIAGHARALTRRLAPPRTLVAAGGETLRALCVALGAGHLEVYGQVVPGVPRATMRGGLWDGTDVVSKSGAFGGPALLRRLVCPDRAGEGGIGA